MEIKFNVFLTFLLWVAPTTGDKFKNASTIKFPEDFKFGVSSSAHQVEGGWNEDGKGMSVWDYLSHVNPVAFDYEANGDVGSDSYHLYKRDVEILEELGVNSYKFSISWARVLPNGLSSNLNPKGVAYYNNLIDELLAKGIEPFVNMYHFDLPQQLQEKGGLQSDDFPKWFGDYARVLYQNFGNRVKYWMTITEPYVHCMLVFEIADHAPQVYMPGIGFYKCIKNILLAHAKAYRIYNKEFRSKQNGKISIDANVDWPIASTNSKEDEEAVLDYMAYRFGLYMDPIYSKHGNYPQRVIDRVALMSSKQGLNSSRLPALTDEEIVYIRGTADYLALNHYSSDMVYRNATAQYHVPSLWGDCNYETYKDPAWLQSAQSWLCLNAPGFYNLLVYVKETYNNPTIYIIESGFPHKRNGLIDDEKILYLRSYLQALNDALQVGVKVKGYFFWSLIDTFEWTSGYTLKFGLYEIDFKHPNKTRTARKSALVYKEIIRSRVIDYEYDPDPLIGRNGATAMTGRSLIGLLFLVVFLLVQ